MQNTLFISSINPVLKYKNYYFMMQNTNKTQHILTDTMKNILNSQYQEFEPYKYRVSSTWSQSLYLFNRNKLEWKHNCSCYSKLV